MSPTNCLQTCEDLSRASAALTAALNKSLGGAHGISTTELLILRTLDQQPAMRRIDLADALSLTPSGITRALRPMEKIGLVQTHRDPQDARASRTSLTNAGRERLHNASSTAADRAEMLLTGRLSADEQARLRDLLARLLP